MEEPGTKQGLIAMRNVIVLSFMTLDGVMQAPGRPDEDTSGKGKRLFGEGTHPAALRLTDSLITSNAVIFANYKRTGKVKTGTVGATCP